MAPCADKATRRRRYWIGGWLVILFAASLFARHRYLSSLQVQVLASEIRAYGGDVHLGASFLEKLQTFGLRRPPSSFVTSVELAGPHFDSEWLRQNHQLSDLPTARLSLQQSPLTTAEIIGLIKQHPLESAFLRGVSGMDSITPFLADLSRLEDVNVYQSDLSDAGLRRLPLEQLVSLNVAETRVTARGLQELRRCLQLEHLAIDGTQFEPSLNETLRSMPALKFMVVTGPGFDDQDLESIGDLPLDRVHLESTSVTEEGANKFRSNRPGCTVSVY